RTMPQSHPRNLAGSRNSPRCCHAATNVSWARSSEPARFPHALYAREQIRDWYLSTILPNASRSPSPDRCQSWSSGIALKELAFILICGRKNHKSDRKNQMFHSWECHFPQVDSTLCAHSSRERPIEQPGNTGDEEVGCDGVETIRNPSAG